MHDLVCPFFFLFLEKWKSQNLPKKEATRSTLAAPRYICDYGLVKRFDNLSEIFNF